MGAPKTKVNRPQNEDADNPAYKDDFFRMYCMKILPCSKRSCHDWTTCPFAHPAEKAKRRDPRVYKYAGILCPETKKNAICPRGNQCPCAHNVFEYWLHPSRYRTQLCNDGVNCRRKICFFAHKLEELRMDCDDPSDIDLVKKIYTGGDQFEIQDSTMGLALSSNDSFDAPATGIFSDRSLIHRSSCGLHAKRNLQDQPEWSVRSPLLRDHQLPNVHASNLMEVPAPSMNSLEYHVAPQQQLQQHQHPQQQPVYVQFIPVERHVSQPSCQTPAVDTPVHSSAFCIQSGIQYSSAGPVMVMSSPPFPQQAMEVPAHGIPGIFQSSTPAPCNLVQPSMVQYQQQPRMQHVLSHNPAGLDMAVHGVGPSLSFRQLSDPVLTQRTRMQPLGATSPLQPLQSEEALLQQLKQLQVTSTDRAAKVGRAGFARASPGIQPHPRLPLEPRVNAGEFAGPLGGRTL